MQWQWPPQDQWRRTTSTKQHTEHSVRIWNDWVYEWTWNITSDETHFSSIGAVTAVALDSWVSRGGKEGWTWSPMPPAPSHRLKAKPSSPPMITDWRILKAWALLHFIILTIEQIYLKTRKPPIKNIAPIGPDMAPMNIMTYYATSVLRKRECCGSKHATCVTGPDENWAIKATPVAKIPNRTTAQRTNRRIEMIYKHYCCLPRSLLRIAAFSSVRCKWGFKMSSHVLAATPLRVELTELQCNYTPVNCDWFNHFILYRTSMQRYTM